MKNENTAPASAQPDCGAALADCHPSCGYIGAECDFPYCKAPSPASQPVAPETKFMRVGTCVATARDRVIIATAITAEWADRIVNALAAVAPSGTKGKANAANAGDLWNFAMGKAADACERYAASGMDTKNIAGMIRSMGHLVMPSQSTATSAAAEHIRDQITADANCILRLLDTVDKLVGSTSGATESIQEHAQHIVQYAASTTSAADAKDAAQTQAANADRVAAKRAAMTTGSCKAESVMELCVDCCNSGSSGCAAMTAAPSNNTTK